MLRFALSALIALSALGYGTWALAERAFPPNAQRGEMKAFAYPNMKIGDRTLRFAAGGRIYNEQNMIIMPASLQKQGAQIIYTTDINGQLGAVWLLTPAEIRKYPRPTTKPGTPPADSADGRK